MKSVCALLLCLVAVAAASYSVFPYAGYANYPVYPYYFGNFYGYGGYTGYNGYNGYNNFAYGVGHPHYRVGVQYHFLGVYGGQCGNNYNYGFYYAGADTHDSYIVCDHGRSFRFQCPAGTRNPGAFTYNTAYQMNDLCSVHTK